MVSKENADKAFEHLREACVLLEIPIDEYVAKAEDKIAAIVTPVVDFAVDLFASAVSNPQTRAQLNRIGESLVLMTK